MNSKEVFTGWLRRFGMIHGFVMMFAWLGYSLFAPDIALDVTFLGKMLLFSFCGSLPGLVYISRHDLTEREWWGRTFIHYLLLNAVLLPLTQMLGLWRGITGIIVFAVIILAVDLLVHGLSFGLDWILARDVNLILSRERQTPDCQQTAKTEDPEK